MGASKLKKLNQVDPPTGDLVKKICLSVQKLMEAGSPKIGVDCYAHAAMVEELLKRSGFECKVVFGKTMWRVGQGDGDVITHNAEVDPVTIVKLSPDAFPFHAWVEVGHFIIDSTTYQLPHKAKMLDEADGNVTQVDWAPPYLYVNKKSVSTSFDVMQLNAGMYYYEADDSIKNVMSGVISPLDEYDINLLVTIFNSNDDLLVIGPNSIKK